MYTLTYTHTFLMSATVLLSATVLRLTCDLSQLVVTAIGENIVRKIAKGKNMRTFIVYFYFQAWIFILTIFQIGFWLEFACG